MKKQIHFSSTGKEDTSGKKRKGSSPTPTDKSLSAKKKTPEEKKVTGFDRGLEPEKILGEYHGIIKI